MNTTIIADKTIFLSKKGMKEFKKSIAQLERDRKKTLQELRELERTLGREERMERAEKMTILENIEVELADKKTTLSRARLLPSERTPLQVAIGSVVDLIDKHGHLFRFTLVDSIEADPSDGRISTLSPLGRSLIGRAVKDTISWSVGKKTNRFILVKIA